MKGKCCISSMSDLINHEICCNFTHIIFVSGTDGIDLSSDDTPICGSI